jgi:hypothetical protein
MALPPDVTQEFFAALVETTFETGGLRLQLVEVSALGAGRPGGRAPFSLIFRGSPGLRQGTHRLQSERAGEMEIFLVPIGPGQYQAIFG